MDSGISSVPPYSSSIPESAVYDNKVDYGQEKSTVVVIQQDTAPVRDDFLWSIFNSIYLNACCLGFIALTYSVKSRDKKLFGDRIGATTYGSTARKLNIAATVVSITCLIIIIIIQATANRA